KSECTRLSDLLDVKHAGIREKIEMPIGVLTLGFEWNEEDWGATRDGEDMKTGGNTSPLVLIGHHEIFHRYHTRRRLRAIQGARPIDSFLDLQPGDYVVHIHHGIAKFENMTSITRDG